MFWNATHEVGLLLAATGQPKWLGHNVEAFRGGIEIALAELIEGRQRSIDL
jgi:hypothetical protein